MTSDWRRGTAAGDVNDSRGTARMRAATGGRRMRTRQRSDGKGGGSDQNPKLWCHVTFGQRRRMSERERESSSSAVYI